MDLIPKPDQVVAAAGNVAHTLLYGGLADLRPMPRTLIDDGELREVYHYRPVAATTWSGLGMRSMEEIYGEKVSRQVHPVGAVVRRRG